MSKRISKTLYGKIPGVSLVEMSTDATRVTSMFKTYGISCPALEHHIRGIDLEINKRVMESKKKKETNINE
jgi:hypothetical protein